MVKRLSKSTVKRIIEYSQCNGISISYLSICKNCNKLRGEHYGMSCHNGGKKIFSKDDYLTQASIAFFKTILKGKIITEYKSIADWELDSQGDLTNGNKSESKSIIW